MCTRGFTVRTGTVVMYCEEGCLWKRHKKIHYKLVAWFVNDAIADFP